MSATALSLRDIDKRFGNTLALDGASCDVRPGTVHGLLGENGAGKTTLMRIAFGLEHADGGTITVNDQAVRFHSGRDAIAAGLGMVHQHFMLVPALTVAENAALGGHGGYDARASADRVRSIAASTGLAIDPEARVRALPVGAQQRAELVRALAHDARILILDEPTAVLTPTESDDLYRWMRRFADEGGTILLITHKLREALAVADDITVLRRGRTVLSGPRAAVTEAQLVEAIVGEGGLEENAPAVASIANDGEAIFGLDDVSWRDERGVVRLRDVTLEVRRGEILGVLGVEGAGQRELLRVLAGRLSPSSGNVVHPARVGFIPEDRLLDAVIPSMTLTENLVLGQLATMSGLIRWADQRAATEELLDWYEVRADGPGSTVGTLSGGNQQKFVVGRERRWAPQALVAENPTRGLDIRAAARVLEAIRAVAHEERGAAVVFSSDLDEVLSLTRRIVVCFDGRVTEVVPAADSANRAPYARALLGLQP